MPIAGLAAIALCTLAAPTSATAEEGQNGQIHIQKICPGTTFTGANGSYCSVTVSDQAALPISTKIYYNGLPAVKEGEKAFLDSPVVLYVDTTNWAIGRCTVNLANAQGLCIVTDGVGQLAGFSARIDVRIDFLSGIIYWDGTYSFAPLPPR
jgi:hypothetical protein